MEFLRWIFESIPRSAHGSSFLEFIVDQGPLIAALATLFFILAEVVIRQWRRGRHLSKKVDKFLELFSAFVLMFGVVMATGFGLYAVSANSVRKPQEVVWRELVDRKLHKCLTNFKALAKNKQDEIKQRLEKIYESSELHCLANAVQKSSGSEPMVQTNATAASRFRVDIKLADVFLQIPDVSDILGIAFSIDGTRFLGYGYSLPKDAKRYSDAKASEYLIRNRCATSGKPNGPCAEANTASPQILTWVLDPLDVATKPDEKISSVLNRVAPEDNREAFFKTHIKDIALGKLAKSPPVLIRFQKFSISNYGGTIGRLNATYVFFSSLPELRDKTIAESETISGRLQDLRASGDPGLRIFVWLYIPSSEDDARAATWENIFTMVKSETRVDPEIAKLAEE